LSSSTDRIAVGRIGRPHGVRGEVTVVVESDDPARFAPGAMLLSDGTEPRPLTVRSARPFRDRGMIVGFEGVDDRRSAELLRGTVLTIAVEERRELNPDEYWADDLIGLTAVDAAGARLGDVVGVLIGPQDRLVVRTAAGRDVEVPFVAAIVGDPEGGRLQIDAPAGLFDDAG
jgi:16S rRNA processing protein RimM